MVALGNSIMELKYYFMVSYCAVPLALAKSVALRLFDWHGLAVWVVTHEAWYER